MVREDLESNLCKLNVCRLKRQGWQEASGCPARMVSLPDASLIMKTFPEVFVIQENTVTFAADLLSQHNVSLN